MSVSPPAVEAAAAPGGPRTSPIVVVAAVVAVVVAAVVAVVLLRDPAPLPGIARTPALSVQGMEFVDYADSDAGVPADLVPEPGELTVAYFGYLSCPDVCPTTMADIRVALQQLDEDEASRITVAFVTVDEERDDGPKIRDFLSLFYPDLPNSVAALRADAGTGIRDAADTLQVYYEIAEHEPGDLRYDVGHSAVTFIIDDTGTVLRELPFGASPDDFATVLVASLES